MVEIRIQNICKVFKKNPPSPFIQKYRKLLDRFQANFQISEDNNTTIAANNISFTIKDNSFFFYLAHPVVANQPF